MRGERFATPEHTTLVRSQYIRMGEAPHVCRGDRFPDLPVRDFNAADRFRTRRDGPLIASSRYARWTRTRRSIVMAIFHVARSILVMQIGRPRPRGAEREAINDIHGYEYRSHANYALVSAKAHILSSINWAYIKNITAYRAINVNIM